MSVIPAVTGGVPEITRADWSLGGAAETQFLNGAVVIQGTARAERVQVSEDAIKWCFRAYRLLQALSPEELFLRIGRFGDAVGIQQQ